MVNSLVTDNRFQKPFVRKVLEYVKWFYVCRREFFFISCAESACNTYTLLRLADRNEDMVTLCTEIKLLGSTAYAKSLPGTHICIYIITMLNKTKSSKTERGRFKVISQQYWHFTWLKMITFVCKIVLYIKYNPPIGMSVRLS